jgi:hypothetical protein
MPAHHHQPSFIAGVRQQNLGHIPTNAIVSCVLCTGEAEDAEESTGLLGQFVEYIKTRKTVPLEQLATEFKLRTTDVIDRINGLEAMGRITGVMDERGKV